MACGSCRKKTEVEKQIVKQVKLGPPSERHAPVKVDVTKKPSERYGK